MSTKYFIDNAPEEEGTQFCLTHSLTDDQQFLIEKPSSAYYNDDGDADNVFVNCNDEDKEFVKAQLVSFGFVERIVE